MRFSPDKKLHSREHLLADDLAQEMREPKRFAAYLGLAQLYEESDLRALARYVREKENLPQDVWGKYFFGSVKNLKKKFGARLKNSKKKTLLVKKLRTGKEFKKQKSKNGQDKKNSKRTKSGAKRRGQTRTD